MEVISVDEVYNKIQPIAEDGNGFVKTSQIEAAGIRRAGVPCTFGYS